MAWMYIVVCSDGSFYTGSTVLDPHAREWQHNHDDVWGAQYTRKRRPVRLVYIEEFDRIDDAFDREKQIQGWSRAKKLALMEHRGVDLPGLASSGRRLTAERPDASTSSATGTGAPHTEADP